MNPWRRGRREIAHTLHLTRRREIALLRAWLVRSRGQRRLDLGCGDGYWTCQLETVAGTHLGIDIRPDEIERADAWYSSAAVRFALADAMRLPFCDGSFDRATCVCSLQNFGDSVRTLCELARVMVPGGLFALSVDSLLAPSWVSVGYRRHHAARFSTGRVFDLDILRQDLRASGFEIQEHRWLLRSRWAAFWMMQQERLGWSVNWWFPLSIPFSRLLDRLTPHDQPGLILVALARRVANANT